MNRVLISSLLVIGLLATNVSYASEAPKKESSSEIAKKAAEALAALAAAQAATTGAQAGAQAASEIVHINEANTPSSVEHLVRTLLGGFWRGGVFVIGGGIKLMYKNPLTTFVLGATAGTFILYKFPQARMFVYARLPRKIQALCDIFSGSETHDVVPASAEQVQQLVTAHQQATEASQHAIAGLQKSLQDTVQQLQAIQAGSVAANEQQRKDLIEQITKIQTDLLEAHKQHVSTLEQQQKDTEARINATVTTSITTQLQQHLADIQVQQQAARQELDQHVQAFDQRLVTVEEQIVDIAKKLDTLTDATRAGLAGVVQEMQKDRKILPQILDTCGRIIVNGRKFSSSISRNILHDPTRRDPKTQIVISLNGARRPGFVPQQLAVIMPPVAPGNIFECLTRPFFPMASLPSLNLQAPSGAIPRIPRDNS